MISSSSGTRCCYVNDAAKKTKKKKNVLRGTSSWNKMMIAIMLFMIPYYANALITCPRPINGTLGTPMGSEIVSLQPERTVTIANTIQTNELCTLVHVITKENEIVSMIPVGRSYGGRSWHRVAGPYKTKLAFDCTGLTSSCKVTLPSFVTDTTPTSSTTGEEPTTTESHSYVLISYKHSITKEEDIARFLEQTTFGPTKSDITELKNTTYGDWIHDQIYTKEMTLHRAHYRKRSNARSTYTGRFLSSKGNNNDITNYGSSQDIGISKLPCDNESRWRNYAFTVEEAATRWNAFTVKVSDTDPTNYFAIVDVFGNQRTEVPVGWPGFDIGSFFYLCYQDRYVMEEWIGGYLRISPSFTSSCYNVPGGNPKIQFHSLNTPEHVVNFSPSSIVMVPMTTDYKQQRIGGINQTNVTFVNRNWEHSNFLLTNGPVSSEYDVCQLDVKYWNDGTKLAHGVMDFGSTKTWYIHDPHLILQSNDLSNPLQDGGGSNKYIGSDTWCSNAPRTFLNEQTCRMSYDASACQATEGYSFDLRDVTLDEATLQDFYKRTGRLIYALNMTEPDTTPCDVTTSKKSRWMKRHDLSSSQSICESSNPVSTNTPTINAIKTKLATSPVGLNNLPVVDIQMSTNDPCDVSTTPKKLRLFVTNTVDSSKKHCWEHVHFDEMNIYDFTDWSIEHGTSQYSSRSDAISQFAERGESYLVFPFWKNAFHTQDRWLAKKDEWMGLPIGLLNSTLAFDNLPTKLKTNSVLQKYIIQTTDDSTSIESGGVGTIVCGSPGEIGNDPTLGDEYDMLMDERWDDRTWGSDFSAQKHSVWTDIVLSESNDQLRQRMAWSLSQLIPMVPGDITKRHKTEPYLAFYDIFVRNAFGNYFDILKEISYHPMMAAMLTFLESKSRGYISKTQGITGAFPDENFAREIMQLFSIGLVQLNMDGTPIYYPNDETTVKQTYTNLDIMDNARAWTGFERQGYERGNIEHFRHPDSYHNLIDLMKLRYEWRDVFPKASIYDEGYIGDGHLLCVDLPKHSYLRKGATYRLLGSRPVPTLQHDPKEWEFDSNTEHLTLSDTGTSELYNTLCQADSEGTCDFQSVVTLDSHLTCDETTNECYVDRPRIVKLGGHSDPEIYYEYVAPSCVQFPFYSSPLKIITRGDTTGTGVEAMCANPKLPHASEACCDTTGYVENAKRSHCMFSGELITYESSIERCSLANLQPCSIYNKLLFEPTTNNNEANCIRSNINPPSDSNGNCCVTDTEYHWTNEPCDIQIVINENGEIAIRHEHNDVDVRTGNIRGQIAPDVGDTTVNFFRVYWRHGSYPSVADGTCGTGSTSEDDDEECYMELTNCVCHVSVKNQQVFQDIPTKEQALKLLRIGSVSPDWYDNGDCVELGMENGIKAWDCTSGGEGEEFTEDTIFEIMEPPSPGGTAARGTMPYNPNEPLYLKNMFSSVTMYRGTYQFRNPPHFMTLNEPSVRDAQHETDAVLQQLFYHFNTAPFVSHRLIQRFGISNPSPEYIESVSQAFVSGLYTHDGIEFGSTGYGDLAATCAAIILHPESRNAVVDSDPFHGSLREPFLKVIHFMRSMEIQPQVDLGYKHVRLSDITSKIGQFVHAIPNVFSFFLSDNIPSGRLNVASLSSPEVGVANTPTIMGLLGGLFSLIKYGLTGCYSGFGSSDIGECGIGTAQITYEPSTAVSTSGPGSALKHAIDEMSLLLTGGRLKDKTTKELIHTVSQNGGYNYNDQIRIAQQLIVSTPEFHSNGGVIQRQLDAPRNESPPPTYSGNEYKAIVFFFMKDGMDSYNMLVPDDTECSDMFQMYQTTRGSVALDPTSELLPPFSAGGTQPTCDKYRFHHQLSTVHQLYNEGDLMLFANMGVSLEDNINKDNWEQTHYPTKLFAHDVQQKETMTVDPFQQVSGTGVLGRITDALNTLDTNDEPLFHTGASSLVGKQFALYNREDGVSSPLITYLSEDGVTKFDPLPSTPDMFSTIQTLNGPTTYNSHAFGDLWSQSASQALLENEYLYNLLDGATLDNGSFPSTTDLSNKMSMIAKLIKLHENRGIDRDVFFVNQGGWDVHSDAKSRTSALFENMDDSLRDFSNELKAQGHWNNTVVVMLSEFGRTLTPNTGGGTDHGWGGNYFCVGGNVKGAQMKGTYPENYDDYDVSRARLHPTIPNEAMWNGIAEWFDVPLDQLDEVLPNRYKFVDSNKLFTKADMFH